MAKIAQLTPAQHTRLSQHMQRTGVVLGLVSGLGFFGLFVAIDAFAVLDDLGPTRVKVSMFVALLVVGVLAGRLLGCVVMRMSFCGTLLASQLFSFVVPFVVGLVFDLLMFDPSSEPSSVGVGAMGAGVFIAVFWFVLSGHALFVGVVFATRWSSALRTFATERATPAR